MNAFQAAQRLYALSEELSDLATQMGKTRQIDDRARLESKINTLEVEFFRIKHRMERVFVPSVA